MISHLHIENFAVIKNVDINFGDNLNIITGETGAGKSIIIDAINAIMGRRISKDIIRQGCDNALVSALFINNNNEIISILNNMGYEAEENEILIYREFNVNGKNICKINGRPATVSILKSLGDELISTFGQHESYGLFSPDTHMEYIDIIGNLKDDIKEYKNLYEKLLLVKNKLKSIVNNNAENARMLDLLKYQINELEEANLVSGEKEELLKLRDANRNSEKIMNSMCESADILNGNDMNSGAVDMVEKAMNLLGNISEYNSDIERVYNQLSNVYYELDECRVDVQNIREQLDYNPKEINRIESRLDYLDKLSRKYGETTDDMINFLDDAKRKLSEIELSDEQINDIKNEYDVLYNRCYKKAEYISEKRNEIGNKFIEKVEDELKFLDMPYVKLFLNQEKCDINDKGIDKIEIWASTNKGDTAKPINKIASGGELSRIMLAIKNTVSDSGNSGTLIFDEVDTGVSGSAARKIGIKLKELSREKQVICITHLAQIAAMGDEHFMVDKKTENNITSSHVNKLSFEERKIEIARIIGGLVTSEINMKNAEEMLINSNINIKGSS